MNRFRLSRRGRKLQISDDQRTLLALPRDVPERTWAEVLQKEENDLVCFDVREEIVEEALRIGYEHYMDKQNALFTGFCVQQAWIKLIDWNFYRHDPGEEPSAYPPCFIPKREESWVPDQLPAASPKDTWGKQDLIIVEDTPDEPLLATRSLDSLEFPVVEEIPKKYWFPGRVQFKMETEELPYEQEAESYDEAGRLKRPLVRRQEPLSSTVWEYIQGVPSSSESTEVSPGSDTAASEVLQKVTDYSTEELSPKTSAMKNTTPVDGSLHGAGDSTVDRLRVKRSQRRFDKSKSGFSRQGIGRSRAALPPLDDSRSRISVISDCRLRNLRYVPHVVGAARMLPAPCGVERKAMLSEALGEATPTVDFCS